MTLPADVVEAIDETEGLERFHRNGWTDGLPIVLPTQQRVLDMLAYSNGLEPETSLGAIGPSEGEATIVKLAINAVMAGCLPEYFPVVLASVEAVLHPDFAHGQMQETTHPLTPLIIINGPIRQQLDIASGAGALGPGHRANASIGRALRLILINVGGARPGAGDMAIMGTPAKFAMCVGEAEEASPFEPLAVARGFDPTESFVTVVPVEAPHLVVSVQDASNAPEAADILLATMAATLANVGSPGTYMGEGNVVALFNPDHASILKAAGMDRRSIQEDLWRRTHNDHAFLRRYSPRLVRQEGVTDDTPYPLTRSPDGILVAVCGAGGYYSVAMPALGGVPGKGLAITKRVRTAEICEM